MLIAPTQDDMQRTKPTVREAAHVSRAAFPGLYETCMVGEERDEIFLTATPLTGENQPGVIARVARRLAEREARVVGMTVWNGDDREESERLLRAMGGGIQWPISRLQSEGGERGEFAGVEVHAVQGAEVRTILLHDRVVGCAWKDERASYCELGNLSDDDRTHTPPMQARNVLEDMSAALGQAGMTFANVYRTWFRNRNILGWYGDFNRVRTEYYTQLRVFDGLLPASTAIGAGNPHGAAVVAGLLALSSSAPEAGARIVDSPMQGCARKYGSSFSRAVEVHMGDHRHLFVSGTASIDPFGRTAHRGDLMAQIALTMRVVHAILNSRAMDWRDVVRGLAYFRRRGDMASFDRWRLANEVDVLPVIPVAQTICRDDLLYEIEVDAVATI
jgi:enamine deaminase RidA (YjgF/YER057c/UK114 family)